MEGRMLVVLLLLLQLVATWAQFLSPLEPSDQAAYGGDHTLCDDCSDRVQIGISFPFGDYCHQDVYIGVNGVISFGEEFGAPNSMPEPFPGSTSNMFFAYLVAPLWDDASIEYRGSISWAVYLEGEGGGTGNISYLSQVSQFIQTQKNVSFTGDWMMVVDYNGVPEFLGFPVPSQFPQDVNTYQVILITNGTKSYAVYTYVCGKIEWGDDSTVIGYNAAGNYFMNYDLSGMSVEDLGCNGEPSQGKNIIYDLVPQPQNLDCEDPTPTIPSSLASCRESGYDTCCVETPCGSTPPECYCDTTCHFFGDCCHDIDEICPRGEFTIGDTYLLFANTYHINRVSVDGSAFEILYSDPYPYDGGITGLDYDYSEDYMYWSNDRQGTLNRAHLNGSSPEVLLVLEEPAVSDIAVDWINKKLYWTQELRGEVFVMDIESRQKTVLITNFNASSSRAIAVDPTTRYMYWSDVGERIARIERAGMDGSGREVLHSTNLIHPNGITIDIPNQRIYWIDASADTIEYSNVNGSNRILLERRNDQIFHPFSITLAGEFLFWTDWVEFGIYTTHNDQPYANVVALDLYAQLLYTPHGIEAVTADRQPEVTNPCSSVTCNSTSMCLLSPSTADGYKCVCTDPSICEGPTPPPTPPPTPGSCRLAGYTSCCLRGLCRGFDPSTGGRAACTCDSICTQLGTCCPDIADTCPEVQRLCSLAGHEECCPAGSGCTDTLGLCSCDADCLENGNCCDDALHLCIEPPTPSSTPPSTEPSSTPPPTQPPKTTAPPSVSPTPTTTPPPPVTEVPGSVRSLEAVRVSDSSLRVSWSEPQSGGRVDTYLVTIQAGSGGNVNINQTTEPTILIEGLVPEVPYNITVEAMNFLGRGVQVNTVAFTREGTPSVSPTVTLTWISLTTLEVSWEPLTLEQARGFITAYTITYTPLNRGRKRQNQDGGTKTVGGDETSAELTDLDPSTQYSVSVAAKTVAGRGVANMPITSPDAGILFQLHFLDVPSCTEWRLVEEGERVDQIVKLLTSSVNSICTECSLQATDIASPETTLASCDESRVSVNFRALLLGDPIETQEIVAAITKWVEEGPGVNLGDLTVKLNSDCGVVIESLSDEFCEETTQPPSATTDASSKEDSSNIVGIVVPIMIVLVLIIVVLVLVVAVLLIRNRQRQKEDDPYLSFDGDGTRGTTRTPQNLYTPTTRSRSREFENPIYGEQEEEVTKTDLELEYLEDPSILK